MPFWQADRNVCRALFALSFADRRHRQTQGLASLCSGLSGVILKGFCFFMHLFSASAQKTLVCTRLMLRDYSGPFCEVLGPLAASLTAGLSRQRIRSGSLLPLARPALAYGG